MIKRQPAKGPKARNIKDIMRSALTKMGVPARLSTLQIRRVWPEIVGETANAGTTVLGLRKGVVTVQVASTALKVEMENFRAAEMVRELQIKFPEKNIKKLKFVLK